jgi:hypothetical protein
VAGPLSNSVAEIVQYLLVQLGVATLPVGTAAWIWPIYEGTEPDQPDNVITVYDTDSVMEGRTTVDSEKQSHYGFQVRVRASDKPTAFLEANEIAIALDTRATNVSVTVADPEIGTHVYSISAVTRQGDPLYIGAERATSKRKIYTVNATVALRQAS